jgi:hypothetical protein
MMKIIENDENIEHLHINVEYVNGYSSMFLVT